jgi:predicted dinucleotide-utilizing enzyme
MSRASSNERNECCLHERIAEADIYLEFASPAAMQKLVANHLFNAIAQLALSILSSIVCASHGINTLDKCLRSSYLLE